MWPARKQIKLAIRPTAHLSNRAHGLWLPRGAPSLVHTKVLSSSQALTSLHPHPPAYTAWLPGAYVAPALLCRDAQGGQEKAVTATPPNLSPATKGSLSIPSPAQGVSPGVGEWAEHPLWQHGNLLWPGQGWGSSDAKRVWGGKEKIRISWGRVRTLCCLLRHAHVLPIFRVECCWSQSGANWGSVSSLDLKHTYSKWQGKVLDSGLLSPPCPPTLCGPTHPGFSLHFLGEAGIRAGSSFDLSSYIPRTSGWPCATWACGEGSRCGPGRDLSPCSTCLEKLVTRERVHDWYMENQTSEMFPCKSCIDSINCQTRIWQWAGGGPRGQHQEHILVTRNGTEQAE